MDNEEKTNEPQKPDGFTPGIERMTEKLETVFSTAMQALQVAPKLESGGHKWMVLSKAIGETRHVLGPCAIMPDACFHKLHEFVSTPPASGTGAFHTPKEIIDFVTANPPLGEVKDAPTPLDPSAPEMVQGGGAKASVPHRKAKFVIEIGGVEFVREVMEGFILYHGAHSTPGGHNPKQWAMEVYRSPSGVVRAVAYNGGDKPVMNISGRGNFKVLDRMAVNALGGFVRAAMKPGRIHKSARRTAKAAETEGAPNV